MGLKAGLYFFQKTSTSAPKYMDSIAFGTRKWVKPTTFEGLRFSPSSSIDTVEIAAKIPKIKLKMFSPQEISEMKPSSFAKILETRTDIPQKVKENIISPEKLNLYDTLLTLDSVKNMPKEKLDEAMGKLFGSFNNKYSEPSAQLEIIPDLIKKGYSFETLASLPITNANKNQVEPLLKRKDLIEKLWKQREEDIISRGKARNFSEETIQRELNFNKRNFEAKNLHNILCYLNDKNAKYLDECIELTGSPVLLPYWREDSSRILKEFGGSNTEIFDRLLRRSHNYDSVKKILGEDALTKQSARLLEFKNFEKVKNINLESFETLSVQERKDFLNSFISAISPKEAKFTSQHKDVLNISYLKSKMKIFEELDGTTNETFFKSYNNIIREMLLKIPAQERKIIRTSIDTKTYRRAYREANPIPTLVDEIQTVLPKGERKTINGRNVWLTTMEKKANFGISTHRIPYEEAINTVETLEMTDPNMLLCVGTYSKYSGLNYNPNGYAIAVKPRNGGDWHVQARGDIDSGNNAEKNIFNFENIILSCFGNHCGCIDTVPNEIKKILDLSQKEYTQRMSKLKGCTTLQDIDKIDKEMAETLRKIIKEQYLYEGLMRPEPMGVLVSETKPLETVGDDILRYCELRNIPLIRVKE